MFAYKLKIAFFKLTNQANVLGYHNALMSQSALPKHLKFMNGAFKSRLMFKFLVSVVLIRHALHKLK